MRFKSIIFISIFLMIFSFKQIGIKAHNFINGGSEDRSFYSIYKKDRENKLRIFKKNKKLFNDKDSCINNYLCRG